MSGVDHVTVVSGDAGSRLDHWFKRHFPDLGLGRLQKLLRTGQIRVDGKRVKANHRVEEGETIRIPPLGPKSDEAKSKKKPQLSEADKTFVRSLVLHEDDRILVINKPPGLAVQGGSGMTRHLDGMLDGLTFEKDGKPRLVHRLDKDTSGVLVLARDAAAAKHLGQAFQARDARKLYWAIVVGQPNPEAGIIDLPLLKSGGGGHEKVTSHPDVGQKAISIYRTIDHAGKKAAWLAMEPRTGRTHQLRVHAVEALECPILGDGKYGSNEAFLDGGGLSRKLHLHARGIEVPHPHGHTVTVFADPPDHFVKTMGFFGFETGENDASSFLYQFE